MRWLAPYPLLAMCACAHEDVPAAESTPSLVALRLIAINDFHGHLEPPPGGLVVDESRVPAGGIAYLAAHVEALRATAKHSMVVSAGDLIGASPLVSALFHDEPTIEAMNRMGLDLNGIGNHELDEGSAELLRMKNGGCHPADGCRGPHPFRGAQFEFLAANVIDREAQATILPPYQVRTFGGVRVAFIGLTLENTAEMLPPVVPDLAFKDEAQTANRWVESLRAEGVRAFVLLLHEGGFADSKDPNACVGLSGPVVDIVERLHSDVDVVISGHTHQAYVCSQGEVLLTSAGSYGRMLTDIELEMDPRTGDVVSSRASNQVVDHGRRPSSTLASLVSEYAEAAGPLAQAEVAQVTGPIERARNRDGVSPMGRLVADAQLHATRALGAEVALMNAGGVRASLAPTPLGNGPGTVTYGMIFAAQPFGNTLVILKLSGVELQRALESQFDGERVRFLEGSSNLSYAWRAHESPHVVPGSVRVDGKPLESARVYAVVMNAYLASKGSFANVADRKNGPGDLDALSAYLRNRSPVSPPALDGLRRID